MSQFTHINQDDMFNPLAAGIQEWVNMTFFCGSFPCCLMDHIYESTKRYQTDHLQYLFQQLVGIKKKLKTFAKAITDLESRTGPRAYCLTCQLDTMMNYFE